jgi:hypothetical protein
MADGKITQQEGQPGLGVDYRGLPVVDPSIAVRLLNEASIKGLGELIDARFQRVDQVIALEVQRNDRRNEADAQRFDQRIGDLRNEVLGKISDRIELFDGAINSVNGSLIQVVAANKEAVNKNELLTDTKFANVDKLLEAMQKDIAAIRITEANFLTIPAYELRHTELQHQVTDLRDSRNIISGQVQETSDSRTQHNWSTGIMVAVVSGLLGFIFSVVGVILKLTGK